MKLSVNVIVILIIALVVLGLILGFVVPRFQTTSSKFVYEQETPEPPIPDPVNQLTISQEVVKVSSQQTAIKASLYNPSDESWDVIGHWGILFKGCAASDSICFINSSNTLCDDFGKDVDCASSPTFMPGDGCVVEDLNDGDPDCAPQDIKLEVYCNTKLIGESYVQDIPANNFRTFTLLLSVPATFEKNEFQECILKSVSPLPREKSFSLYVEK